MADINLIPQEQKATEKSEALQHKLQFFSVAILVLCALAAIGTLGLFATFSSKRTDLAKQVAENSAKIENFKSEEELLVVIKDKASAADSLIGDRTNIADIFRQLAGMIPQGVYFSDIRIVEGKIAFSGRARTSADVAGLATSLTSPAAANVVTDVSIDSLSSSDGGIYSFVASAKLAGLKTETPNLGTGGTSGGDDL